MIHFRKSEILLREDNPLKYLPARRQKCWRGSSTNLHKSWIMMWLGYTNGLDEPPSINEEWNNVQYLTNSRHTGMTMRNINFCISIYHSIASIRPILSNCLLWQCLQRESRSFRVDGKRSIPFTTKLRKSLVKGQLVIDV